MSGARASGLALRLLAGLWLTLAAAEAQAQPAAGSGMPPGEAFALEFRDHVVQIRALGPGGTRQDGFGFVVGENASGVYVVTANHVVRGGGPGEVAEQVMVTWFRRSGEEFPATLLGTSDERRDVAVLRADMPAGMALRPELMRRPSGRLVRSTPVWYVGRGREWYVPSQPGTVNSINLDDQISLDGLNVQVGTSGAPLVTDAGVAGMIIEDTIGGIVKATDIGFVERAFEAWNHPWGLAAEAGAAPAGAGGAGAQAGRAASEGTPPASTGSAALVSSAGRALLQETGPEPAGDGSPEAGPDLDEVRRGLAAFAPRTPNAGTPTGGALTLGTLEVERLGPEELEVTARVELEGIDLGRVTAWVTPGDPEGTVEVGLEPEGGRWGFEVDGCDIRLTSREAHLVWDEALASFTSVQVELGPSTVSCPGAEVTLRGAEVDLAFERRSGGRWDGWVDVALEGAAVRVCDDLPETCEAARAAGSAWPWQELSGLAGGHLLLSLDGADLAKRMAAFEAEPADSWLRRAAFAAAVLDPMVAAAGVLEPAGVADYLGTVAANLSTQGLTISAEGTEVSIEASQGELSMGWPTRLAYDLSGAIVVAPGLLATGPSSGSVAIESAGRLDPTTLLGDGSLAFADAAPFRISARVESEVGHVEGTGTLGVDQYGSPSLVAAEATVTTGDPVGFLNEALLAPMAAQTSDPAALQDAVAEVLAALGWLPLQPGQDRDFAIRYDPLTESVTVEGQDLSALLAALGEACSHRGC